MGSLFALVPIASLVKKNHQTPDILFSEMRFSPRKKLTANGMLGITSELWYNPQCTEARTTVFDTALSKKLCTGLHP